MRPGKASPRTIALAYGALACAVPGPIGSGIPDPIESGARAHELPGAGRQECEAAFRGVVIRDRDFERAFGNGLLFRLAAARSSPPNPRGWTIEVRPAGFPDHEYSYYASPPFRFWNPRYIGTSYGYTAARAVEYESREFRFLTNEEDYARARAAIEVVLWSGNYSRSEHEAAVEELGGLAKGYGALRILDARLAPPTAATPLGTIERLEFEVDLCPRAPRETTPGS